MGDEDKAEGGEELEDISWEDAAADLDKQREMLKEAAEKGDDEGAAPEYPVALPDETEVQAPAGGEVPDKVNRILDIPLKVTVELGRTRMLINDLLQLGQGSVIELSKLVREPLSVRINEKVIGLGEVVVINEKFGIRLTEITSPTERIESLK